MSIIENRGTEVAPFGWYPDPAGSHKLRLWNGTEWTDKLERKSSGVQPVYGYAADGSVTRRFDY